VNPRRVVITGVGAVSALGNNVSEFWSSLSTGRSGIGPLRTLDATQLRCPHGAEVPDYDPATLFDHRQIALLDRFGQFGVLAARAAVADAAIQWSTELAQSTAVVMGTCVGGQTTEEGAFSDVYTDNRTRLQPLLIPRVMANAATSHVALEFGIQGPCYTISTACASSNHAIGQAFWMVRQGTSDVALAGGSEAPFSLAHLRAWEGLRVMASDTCRPFSRNRRGLVLGEGGGVMVLEEMQRARSRGARIYGEVVGFAMTSEAHHITQPCARAAARTMTMALADAQVDPTAVGYINAHGSGTLASDKSEAVAIRLAFGGHTDRVAVSSTKSMHGHALGATGALEAIATVLALKNEVLPPTANFVEPDLECDLDIIANEARAASVDVALSNAFGFGGLNAVLVFRRATDQPGGMGHVVQ
jgi:nodulation protein E